LDKGRHKGPSGRGLIVLVSTKLYFIEHIDKKLQLWHETLDQLRRLINEREKLLSEKDYNQFTTKALDYVLWSCNFRRKNNTACLLNY
jgi:hypothetical protein